MTTASNHTIGIVIQQQQALNQVAAINNAIRGVNSSAVQMGNSANSAFNNLGNSAANANGKVGGLAGSLQSLAGHAGGLGGSLGNVTSQISNMAGQLGSVAGRAGGLVSGLGGIAAAGAAAGLALPVLAIGAMAGKIFEATAAVQTYKASLTTILGDQEKAGQAFDSLAAFAAKTPFTLEQAVTGFSKLRALGLEPSERAMTSYGNTAAAMGKNLDQMVEAVADATTGEFERLKEFGIKSKSEGDKVSFTFQGVTTTVGKNSKDIQNYLMSLGETKFAGGMENQAKTINGAMSSLSDSIFLMFAKMGEGKFAEGVSSAIETISTVITRDVQPALVGMMAFVTDLYDLATTSFFSIGEAISSILPSAKNVGSVGEWIGVVFESIGAIFQVAAGIIKGGIESIVTYLKWAGGVYTSVWNWAFGEQIKGSESAARAQDGHSAWANTRMIDRVRGFNAYVRDFAARIPTMFKIALSAVGDMFGVLGSRFTKLLSGDFAGAFSGIGAELGAIMSGASGAIGKQVAASVAKGTAVGLRSYADSQKGASGGDDLAKFAGPSAASSPSSSGGSKGKGKGKGAQGPKDKTEDYEEALHKYIVGLEDAAKLKEAALTTDGAALAIQEAINKAQETGHRELKAAEKEAISSALTRKFNAEGLKAINDKIADLQKKSDNDAREAMDRILFGEKEAERLARRRAAIEGIIGDLKAKNANVGAAEIQAAIDQFTKLFDAAEKRASAQSIVDGLAKDAQSRADSEPRSRAQIDELFEKQKQGIADWVAGAIKTAATEEDRQAIIARGVKLEDEARKQWIDAINASTSKLSDALNMFGDGISKIFGEKAGGAVKGIAGAIDTLGKTWEKTNPQSGVGQIIKGFQNSADKLGINIGKSLGKTLGAAGMGAEVGAQLAPLGKAIFGGKFSSMGSQLGGAAGGAIGTALASSLGAAAGPIGMIAGSLLGGVIGGLFKKPKWGTSVISMGADGYEVSKTKGNKAEYKSNSSSAGGAAVQGLNQLAEALGGTIGGNAKVSIGQYKGKWRVSETGYSGRLDFKGSSAVGLHNFGKDGQQEALAFAITAMIKQGVLKGVSDFSQRVLKTMDLAEATDLAVGYETILKSLANMKDPVKGAVDEATRSIDSLIEKMKKAGATTAELANVEEWRSVQLKKVLEDQMSGLTDFKKSLSGEGSGVSKIAQLRADQAEWNAMKAKIAAGENVDQGKFTSLGQEIFGLARDVYGTATTEFQNIRADLMNTTDTLINSVQDKYDAATQREIAEAQLTAQDATASNTAITNDFLAQVLAKLNEQNLLMKNKGTLSKTTNGSTGSGTGYA